MTEELQIESRRWVLALLLGRGLQVHELRPESSVQFVWAEGAGVDGSRNEFPERIKVLKAGLVWVIVVGRRVVHVGREPHGILHFLAFHKGEKIGDFEFAAKR